MQLKKIKLFLELFINKKFEYTFVCFFMHKTIVGQSEKLADIKLSMVTV